MNKTGHETILIVDDEEDLLHGLRRLIEPELHCEVRLAGSARQALSVLADEDIGVVLADIRMPDVGGLELLALVREEYPEVASVIMTAYGTIDLAVEALKMGAYDFITKPLDEDRLFHVLRKCLERQRLIRRAALLEQQIAEREKVSRFIGASPSLAKALSTIKAVAHTDMTVLITGESGTGKELAARTIHALSPRGREQMVTVNCPAIPESILESELFGYKKGAFTQATQNKQGLFSLADGSSLFLDEIGDMPMHLQTKLLRALQEKEIRPLGSTRTRQVDVRIIASTNQNLREKIKSGEFREDLYYRLHVASIVMPSLREMREDIPDLARHFLAEFCREHNLGQKFFSAQALRCLEEAAWHGNIRELQNVVKRAAVLSQGQAISAADLDIETEDGGCVAQDLELLVTMPYSQAKNSILEQFSVGYITRQLEESSGNVSSAARKSGLERQSFQHLMRKYNIRSADFKP